MVIADMSVVFLSARRRLRKGIDGCEDVLVRYGGNMLCECNDPIGAVVRVCGMVYQTSILDLQLQQCVFDYLFVDFLHLGWFLFGLLVLRGRGGLATCRVGAGHLLSHCGLPGSVPSVLGFPDCLFKPF